MGRGNWKKKQVRIAALQEKVEQVESSYKVQVIHPSLRRRIGPGCNEREVGLITDQGIYDIYNISGGWGQLYDGSWIMLSFTKRLEP